MDCYTDPLGWKDGLGELGNGTKFLNEVSHIASFCKNVKDVEKLFSMVVELGTGVTSYL